MENIKEIINFSKHPINDSDYISVCKKKLHDNSLLVLNNFLLDQSLNNLLKEATELENLAFYCSQKHTVLLSKFNQNLKNTDPLNQMMISDKGCVPHDLIKENSDLNNLYKSKIFRNFLIKILNLKKIYPYCDTLSSINYNYYKNGQQLGWHFDNASFAITLMIQSSLEGGKFEYVTKGRNFSENYIDKKLIGEIINNQYKPNILDAEPGTLVLFYGRNYLHRVTPVQKDKSRILVTLNYNEEDFIELSENARLTFFGRIK